MSKLPGAAGAIESRQQLMAQAVADQFAIFAPTPAPDPNAIQRRPQAGNLGKPLTTARLP
jgi:hypothetical protein